MFTIVTPIFISFPQVFFSTYSSWMQHMMITEQSFFTWNITAMWVTGEQKADYRFIVLSYAHRWERTLQFQGSKDGSAQMEAPMSADLMCSIEGGWRCKERQWSEHEMLCLQSQSLGIWHIIYEKKAFMQGE